MRKKRLILVIDPDITSLSCCMFVVAVNGFRVVGANTRQEAEGILIENQVDAVYMRKEIAHDFRVPVVVAVNVCDGLTGLRIATAGYRGHPKKARHDAG